MFLISAQKRSNRMQICKNCDHYLTVTKSCGTLGIGSKVEDENGEKVKLCGCVMPIKTGLKISSCPLNKWSKDIKTEDLENLKMLLKELEGATTISGSQNNQLTQLWNIATGGNKRVSRCNTCVRQTINELKNFIKDE
tara:strand:- start:4784 stop:5197 length:414 start_codon:yes stop_codon:yes gene_type:complete